MMEFKLMNSGGYAWFSSIKGIENILARLETTNFKDKVRVATAEGEINIYIEIKTLDELKELYKLFGEQLILSFDEKYPHIVIYDGYIE